MNFLGAMEQLARGYSSVVELSTADRMVSGSNPDVPYLLGIENSTTEPPMRQKIVKACWRAATNAKKNEKSGEMWVL